MSWRKRQCGSNHIPPVVDEMENTRIDVPSAVDTVEECLEETLTVEPTTSVPVVDELECTRDEVPSPVETEERCLKEPLTVETSTSAPVLDETDNYAANEVCKVSGNVEDVAEFKVQLKVLQRQLYQVCGLFFTNRF